MGPMHALFAGLTTLDVVHALDHVPDPLTKTTSRAHMLAAGGPATNAALTFAALERVRSRVPLDEGVTGSVTRGHTEVDLLTATGRGPAHALVCEELTELGVAVLDATDTSDGVARADAAVSSVVEHPGGRFVASTNARVPVDPALGRDLLADARGASEVDVVLVDGHNSELADLALRLGTATGVTAGTHGEAPSSGVSAPDADSPFGPTDPFAELSDVPSHLRILDGGSWKPWFVPLLGLVDVAVVSADFAPPVVTDAQDAPSVVADFLRGFGITRVVRTDGANPVQWWWEGRRGEIEVPRVDAVSTMGAGDVFHGAFAWALALVHATGRGAVEDPVEAIEFASRVAALSTTSFGTRTWMGEQTLVGLVEHALNR